jgi:GMP synthase-like glutamine amidotransferase
MGVSHRPVRLGLLILDSIDLPHRAIAGDYEQLFRDLFEVGGHEIIPVDVKRQTLPAHDECDGWIIPGSRQSVVDDDIWISQLRTWTRQALEAQVPLAGVCFGHQLIAAELGAQVGPAPGGWNIGVIDYEVMDSPPWLNLPSRYRLIASHQDQVLTVSSDMDLVATAATCPVGAFTVGSNVMCVQGHPEFGRPLAASLYKSRIERIGLDAVEKALATLEQQLDRHDVADWLLQTIYQGSPA